MARKTLKELEEEMKDPINLIKKVPVEPKPTTTKPAPKGRKAKSISTLSQQAVEELVGEDATNIFKGAVKQKLTPGEAPAKTPAEQMKETNEMFRENLESMALSNQFKQFQAALNQEQAVGEPSLADKMDELLEVTKNYPDLQKKLIEDPMTMMIALNNPGSALPFLLGAGKPQGNNMGMFQTPFFMLMFSKFFNNQDDGKYVTRDHLTQFGNSIVATFEKMLDGITKNNQQDMLLKFMDKMYTEKQNMTEQNFSNTISVIKELFAEKMNNIQQQLQEAKNRPSELQLVTKIYENLKPLQTMFSAGQNTEVQKMLTQHQINQDNRKLEFEMKRLEQQDEQQRFGNVMSIVDNLTSGVGAVVGSTIADKVMSPMPPDMQKQSELEGIQQINEVLKADQNNQLDPKKKHQPRFNV